MLHILSPIGKNYNLNTGKEPLIKAWPALPGRSAIQLFGNEQKKKESHTFGLPVFLKLNPPSAMYEGLFWVNAGKLQRKRQQLKAQTINFPGESVLSAWRARVTFHWQDWSRGDKDGGQMRY